MASRRFNLLERLKVEDFVDVFDNATKEWRVAVVMEVGAGKDLTLLQDDARHISLSPASNFLQPFRSYSKLPVAPAQQWLQISYLPQSLLSTFDSFTYENFLSRFGAYDLQQTVRGQLFYIGRELLAQRELTDEQQQAVVKIAEGVNYILTSWTENAKWIIPLLYQLESSPAAIYTDVNSSFASVWQEIFALFSLLLSSHLILSQPLLQLSPDNQPQTCQSYFASFFDVLDGGFAKMMHEVMEEKQGSGRLPLWVLQELPIWEVGRQFGMDMTAFVEQLKARVNSYSDLDIKHFSKPWFQRFLQFYWSILGLLSRDVDSLRLLQIPLRLLSCDILAKRTEGAEVLSWLIVETKRKDSQLSLWFPDYIFANFAKKFELVKLTAEEKPNEIVLKKVTEVFLEIARFNYFDTELISTFFRAISSVSSDSPLCDSLYSALFAVCELLPLPGLREVEARLQQLPNTHDARYIARIGRFLSSAGKAAGGQFAATNVFFLDEFISDILRGGEDDGITTAKRESVVTCVLSDSYRVHIRRTLERCVESLSVSAISLFSAIISRFPVATARECLQALEYARERQRLTPVPISQVVITSVLLQDREEAALKEGFALLETVAKVKKDTEMTVGIEDLTILLGHYMGRTQTSDAFFQWLASTESLSRDLLDFMFETMTAQFSLPTLASYPQSVLTCYLHFFYQFHQSRNRLVLADGAVTERLAADLEGANIVSMFAVHSQYPAVRAKATVELIHLLTVLSPTHAKTTVKQFAYDVANELQRPDISTDAWYHVLDLVSRYITRYAEITVATAAPPGPIVVFTLYREETEWQQSQYHSSSTVMDVRKAVALDKKVPPELLCLTYRSEVPYTFANDKVLLADLKHPLHFVVSIHAQPVYEFVPISVAAVPLAEVVMRRLNTEPDPVRVHQLWQVMEELTAGRALQKRISECGKTFHRLMEGTVFEQLLCVFVALRCNDWDEIAAFILRKAPSILFEVLENNAKKGGGLYESLGNVDPRLGKLFAGCWITAMKSFAAMVPRGRFSDFVTFILDLQLIISRDPGDSKDALVPTTVLELFQAAQSPEEVSSAVQGYRHLRKAVSLSMMETKNAQFATAMQHFWTALASPPYSLSVQLVTTLFEIIPEAILLPTCNSQFFSLVESLYSMSQCYDNEEIYYYFLNSFKAPTSERECGDEHSGYAGLFDLLRTFAVMKSAKVRADELEIIADCVFAKGETRRTHPHFPKCKSTASRSAAYRFLAAVAAKDRDCEQLVSKYCRELHYDGSVRKHKISAWMRSAEVESRGKIDCVGLRNLGATCYLNSVVQQLFAVRQFRELVLQYEVRGEKASELQWLQELQRLFIALEDTDKAFVSTKRFCSVYSGIDGASIEPHIQQDASEFLESLLMKCSETVQDSPLTTFFRGQTATTIAGVAPCNHSSTRTESFYCLRIGIERCRSIVEGLNNIALKESMSGENAWKCEQCGQTPAIRETVIMDAPEVLLISLNRFQYSPEFGQKTKVISYCEFPLLLDMSPFVSKSLPRLNKYRLKGVVVHRGSADSGHYTSYVLHSGSWLLFDDTRVTESSLSDMQKSSFGALDSDSLPEAELLQVSTAFLLVYEADTLMMDTESVQYPAAIAALREDRTLRNQRFWRKKRMYGSDYARFIGELLTLGTPLSPFLALQYIFTIGTRTQPLPRDILTRVFALVATNREVATWALSVFSQPPMLSELIVTNPAPIPRKMLISFAVKAYESVEQRTKAAFCRCLARVRMGLGGPVQEHEGFYEVVYRAILAEKEQSVVKDLIAISLSPLIPALPQYLAIPDPPAPEFTLGSPPPSSDLPQSSTPNFTYIPMIINFAVALEDCQAVADSLVQSEFLQQLVAGTVTKLSARHLCYAVSHVMNSRVDLGQALLNMYAGALVQVIEVSEKVQLECALLQLSQLIQTINNPEFTSSMLGAVESMLVGNITKYVHAGELTVSFLYTLSKAHECALQWVRSRPQLVMELEVWREKYQNYSFEHQQDLALDKVHDPFAYMIPFKPKERVLRYISELLPGASLSSPADSEFDITDLPTARTVHLQCGEDTFRAEIRTNFGAVLDMKYVDFTEEFFLAADDPRLRP